MLIILASHRLSPNFGQGALHWPDSMFDSAFDELMALVRARYAACPSLRIVLHCMESARRGPRCAHKLYDRLQLAHQTAAAAGPVDVPLPTSVFVLRGGADHWLRAYYRNPALVAEFDDGYWGWGVDPDDVDVADDDADTAAGIDAVNLNGQGQVVAAAATDAPQHVLYTRPADQTHDSYGRSLP